MKRELRVSVTLVEGATIEANIVDVLINEKSVIVMIENKPVIVSLDKIKFI